MVQKSSLRHQSLKKFIVSAFIVSAFKYLKSVLVIPDALTYVAAEHRVHVVVSGPKTDKFRAAISGWKGKALEGCDRLVYSANMQGDTQQMWTDPI